MGDQEPLLAGSVGPFLRRPSGKGPSLERPPNYGSINANPATPLQTRQSAKDAVEAPQRSQGLFVRERRPFSHRRRDAFTDKEEKQSIGTVRSACTCNEFELNNIMEHYKGRGLEVKMFSDLLWVRIPVPKYRFDSQAGAEEVPAETPVKDVWSELQHSDSQLAVQPTDEQQEREIIDEESSVTSSVSYEEDDEAQIRRLFMGGKEYLYEVFFYPYGVVVWWSPFPPKTDLKVGGKALLREIERLRSVFEIGSADKVELETSQWTLMPSEAPSESDADFQPTQSRRVSKDAEGKIDCDVFFLSSDNPEYKLAYSCGLAQSAKLTDFEDKINEVIENSRRYPQMMAMTGKADLTRKEVARIRGELFLRRMDVNLHTDILETPDFFWNRTDLEPLYLQARKYMEIQSRTDVLNKRLEIVNELFEVLHEELNINHSNSLEWIIIWLILVELVIGVMSALLSTSLFRR
eukprot:Sspe_Gene.39285::Locus_18948_Transcript_1_1_Confidence_1.000_Length_1552::g.39285::m.39285